jgi:hypothetical protein
MACIYYLRLKNILVWGESRIVTWLSRETSEQERYLSLEDVELDSILNDVEEYEHISAPVRIHVLIGMCLSNVHRELLSCDLRLKEFDDVRDLLCRRTLL